MTCVSGLLFLGAFRTVTDAEVTLSSFALLPVFVVAWLGGRNHGLLIAAIAAVMWGQVIFVTPPIQRAVDSMGKYSYLFLNWGLLVILAARVRKQFQREHE